jgi:hypothetical protein
MKRRSIRAALSAVSAVVLAVTLAVPAFAQAMSGDCELLTSEEVGAVLGVEAPTPMVMQGTCTFLTDTGMVTVGVIPGLGLDAQRGVYPGGVDTTIGGFDAYYVPDANQIFVDLDGQQLYIALGVANAGDLEAAITDLAETAAARVPAREAPAEGSLGSMFPSEIGGQSVIVEQLPPDQVATMIGSDARVLERIETTLAGLGKTMADLEIAYGTAVAGQLFAYRIAGADAAAFTPAFVDAFMAASPGSETSVQSIAGKDVTVATMGGEVVAYLYPSGDTLWTVVASEPGLSEILTALP